MLFMGIVLAVPAVICSDAVFARESRDQAAADRIGTGFTWPDDDLAADPETALRILAEAAEDTRLNVLRTSVGTSEPGRNRITHYVLLSRRQTGLFDEFTLRSGRWLNRAESQAGSAIVSSKHTGHNIGVPEVFANGYDLTFAPLEQAFDSLPSAGRYVVESFDDTAVNRFLTIVHQRLVEAGVSDLTMKDLAADGTPDPVHSDSRLPALPYLLAGLATLLVAFMLVREGKRIGVLRLLGHSATRIWYRTVGRLQLTSVLIGLFVCAALPLIVPGVDTAFVRTLAVALGEVAVAGFAATLAVGLVVIHRIQVSDLIKGSMQ